MDRSEANRAVVNPATIAADRPGPATRVAFMAPADQSLPVTFVASDMDGTLLTPERVIHPVTADVVRRAADAGVTVVVATGRNHWSAAELLVDAGLDDGSVPYALCSNGATLFDVPAGEVIERTSLPGDELAEFVSALDRHVPGVVYAWETAENRFDSPAFRAAREATVPEEDNPWPVGEVDIAVAEVVKLLVGHVELIATDLLDALVDHIPATVSASTSGASFIEVTHSSANKGAAVEALCRRLGVDQAATAAFGDHTNDLEMLRWVGRGYVMANAHPRAFDASPLRAPHHAEHGVAQIIAELAGVAYPG